MTRNQKFWKTPWKISRKSSMWPPGFRKNFPGFGNNSLPIRVNWTVLKWKVEQYGRSCLYWTINCLDQPLFKPPILDLHANPNYSNRFQKSFWYFLCCSSPFVKRLSNHQWVEKLIFRQQLHMAKCAWHIENHLERQRHRYHVTKMSCS